MTHNAMFYSYKPKCRQCGKAGSKECDTFYGDEPYNGNQILVKEKKHEWADGRISYTSTTWDGETYKLNGGKFCTSSCAIAWANDNAIQPREAD